ncbi:MAG: EF-P lysine aminoacylase EpmA [Myxococcota bacterium]|nr:EF-P lysine aminoacylase EpmA [Myxococcota bacterium]
MIGSSDRAALRRALELRARVVAALREFLAGRGCVEVETPVLIRAPAPERHIETIAAGDGRRLAASPELQMKRLLAAGSGPIFQIARSFRSREIGRLHNPEFAMLEWYRPGVTYVEFMDECEALVREVDRRAIGPLGAAGPRTLDPDLPFLRLTVLEAFERFAGWIPDCAPDEMRFFADLVDKVEPSLPNDRGVFLYRYPASQGSLARPAPDDPSVAERFEMYLGGIEVANAFTELADPAEQRRRFEAERAAICAAGRDTYPFDEAFLSDVGRMGLCAGAALGVDRLLVALTGAASLRDVLPFTWDDA